MIENVPYLHQMRNDRVKKFMLDAFLVIRKRSKLQTVRYNTLYTSNLKISSVHALLHDHNRSRQRLIYRSYQGECRETNNCTGSDAYASSYIESSAILMVFRSSAKVLVYTTQSSEAYQTYGGGAYRAQLCRNGTLDGYKQSSNLYRSTSGGCKSALLQSNSFGHFCFDQSSFKSFSVVQTYSYFSSVHEAHHHQIAVGIVAQMLRFSLASQIYFRKRKWVWLARLVQQCMSKSTECVFMTSRQIKAVVLTAFPFTDS